MRILHLDSGREMRGGQLQVLRLMEGLIANGAACSLLARAGSPLFQEAARKGWPVEPLSLMRVALSVRRHDLVHAHDGRSHTLAALVGGAPLVVSRRVAFETGSLWKYRRAARVIAVSDFVRQVLVESGADGAKIDVVGDGVPLLPASDWKGGVVAPDNATDPSKGAALVHAAAELADLQIDFVRNLESAFSHAKVFVYLSHSEGLGSAALLAMSAGVPVVASEVGGLAEIVRHRETGMLAQNSPQTVANAVRLLLEDSALARAVAVRARKQVEEQFTVAHMVTQTMKIYKKVLQ